MPIECPVIAFSPATNSCTVLSKITLNNVFLTSSAALHGMAKCEHKWLNLDFHVNNCSYQLKKNGSVEFGS